MRDHIINFIFIETIIHLIVKDEPSGKVRKAKTMFMSQ